MLSLLLILISKSWRGVSFALLSVGAVCVCIPFLVYLLPYLLARLNNRSINFGYFKNFKELLGFMKEPTKTQ
jgi:hypothetical protein